MLASWLPVSKSTIKASSPTHVANKRPLASSAVLPPVYMGRRVRDASKVVLTTAFDMIFGGRFNVDFQCEPIAPFYISRNRAENRVRQSNAVNVLLVLRFHRATFHLFCGPFAAFDMFALFVHITDKRWSVLLTASDAHVISALIPPSSFFSTSPSLLLSTSHSYGVRYSPIYTDLSIPY